MTKKTQNPKKKEKLFFSKKHRESQGRIFKNKKIPR